MEFRFYYPSNPALVTQGHLPHWDQGGATYFITWRTADSIPKAKFECWNHQRTQWLKAHGINPADPDWRRQVEELSEDERKELRRFSRSLDDEMDSCHGECALRRRECAFVVEETLRYFDGERYLLGDFVVMPNHIHVLVGGIPRKGMMEQVASWKRRSAGEINRLLARQGRFWQTEHFDHLVRSAAAFERFRRYIAENPVKAKLREGEYLLWQS